MSTEERERRARWLARERFQRNLDRALAGSSAAKADLNAQWEPMRQFVKEGPDVGETNEAESEAGQRIN